MKGSVSTEPTAPTLPKRNPVELPAYRGPSQLRLSVCLCFPQITHSVMLQLTLPWWGKGHIRSNAWTAKMNILHMGPWISSREGGGAALSTSRVHPVFIWVLRAYWKCHRVNNHIGWKYLHTRSPYWDTHPHSTSPVSRGSRDVENARISFPKQKRSCCSLHLPLSGISIDSAHL